MKYHQKTTNSLFKISLASAFHCINYNRAVLSLVNSTEESLTLEKENGNNRIYFANAIMSNRRKIKREQNLRYNLTIWSENDAFDILNNIREDVTLVQLMESLRNANYAIIIVRHWINR